MDELNAIDEAQMIEREIDAVLDWQIEAEQDFEDWLDHNRTMEDARY